jgi:hypothetical protein
MKKPEAKQIRKLLRQDSTFFPLLATAFRNLFSRCRLKLRKRERKSKNNKLRRAEVERQKI